MSTGYKKIKNMAYRGRLASTGFSDYLFATMMLFILDIGGNGGRRAFTMYRKCGVKNFSVIRTPSAGDIGLWNVDAYLQKHSGAGRRAPYLMLDRGIYKGIVQRYVILTTKRPPSLTGGLIPCLRARVPARARAFSRAGTARSRSRRRVCSQSLRVSFPASLSISLYVARRRRAPAQRGGARFRRRPRRCSSFPMTRRPKRARRGGGTSAWASTTSTRSPGRTR